MAETLPKPIITAAAAGLDITLSGLTDANANGYEVRIGTLPGYGLESAITPEEGVYTLTDNRPRLTYYIQVRALGDDISFITSDWSDIAEVITGGAADENIRPPALVVSESSFTSITFIDLENDRGIRYQIAETAEALPAAAPIFGGTDGGGNSKILGLRPGRTYFIRGCYVQGNRCSEWSEAISAVTEATTNTLEVTSSAASGVGSLPVILAAATDGTLITFASSLAGQTINITTAQNLAGKKIVIDGSGLTDRITYSGAGVTNAGNAHFIGLNLSFQTRYSGNYIDCEIGNSISTAPDSTYKCILTGISVTVAFAGGSFHYGTISANNTVSSGLANGATLTNCFLTGQSSRYISNNSNLNGCTITGNTISNNGLITGSGRVVESDIVGNTLTHSGYNVIGASNVYSSRIANNTTARANAPAYDGLNINYVYDSIFTGNTGTGTDEVGTGNFIRCIVKAAGTRSVTSGAPVFKDSLILGTAPAGNFINCTISKAGGTANNCLIGPGSAVTGNNNLTWDESDESASAYIGKIFIDFAAGDYRLLLGSPAIDAGNDALVTPGDLDLAGLPRLMGSHVDLGAYEYRVYQLAPPTFSISTAAGGQGTVTFTVPPNASAFLLQYADNLEFENAQEISSASSGFSLTGVSGDVFFRAKSIGTPGIATDSEWTAPKEVHFDTTAPIVIINGSPLEVIFGSTVDLLAGVTVIDDGDDSPAVHYQVIDGDGEPISVDGQTIDPRSSGIPCGSYTLRISATDAIGNVGTAERPISVIPPALTKPVISVASVSGDTAIIEGLTNTNASGWKQDLNGTVSVCVPAAGKVTLSGLANDRYTIKVKALGDWNESAASGTWRDSDWSESVSFTISVTPKKNLIEERLESVRTRISAIRAILEDPTTITDITIDGISERIDRRALIEELRMLERQELQLLNGTSGSRFHNVDTSRAW